MVKSYCYDNDFNNAILLENIAVNTIQYLKENDYEIYNLLHSFSRTKQQDILYRMFQEHDENYIEEFDISGGAISLLGMLTSLFLVLFGQTYGVAVGQRFNDLIINVRSTIADFIKNKDEDRRIRTIQKIIDSNFDNCRQKCGMSDVPSEQDKMLGGNIDQTKFVLNKRINPQRSTFEKIFGVEIDPVSEDNAQCLLYCYIGYLTSVFAELLFAYDQCLQKTGERLDFSKGMDVFSSFPVGESCKYLRDKILDIHEDFNDVLKLFFKQQPRLEQNIINQLDAKIKSVKSGQHVKTNIVLPTIEYKPKFVNF
jgi:hypothetical protein